MRVFDAISSRSINPAALGAALALMAAAVGVLLMVKNPVLTFADIIVLALIWRGALNNPIKTAIACLLSAQWVSASVNLWLANALDVSLHEPGLRRITAASGLDIGTHTADAIALALAAIAALSLGARIFTPSMRLSKADFSRFDPMRLVMLYFPLLIVSQFSGPLFGGSLAQLIGAFGTLRFAPLAILVGIWFYSRRGGQVLAAICCTEMALGFLSFFSSWRDALILVGICVLSFAGRRWRRLLPAMVSGVAALLILGTVWTVIKPNYRASLNEGTGQQTVLLSADEQVAALLHEVSNVHIQDFGDGFLSLLARLSYVDYLADVLDHVPSQVEHQHGALWGEAINQLLTPRFLFPNKPALPSDSERTMRFTGRYLASGAQGTSISIGYVGESYIDYGVPGAVIIPFLMGLVCGLGALWLVRRCGRRGAALAFALVISFLLPAQTFESSNVKLVGAFVWPWIACNLMILVWPQIEPFLVSPPKLIAEPPT